MIKPVDYICSNCGTEREIFINDKKPPIAHDTSCALCYTSMIARPVQLTGKRHYDHTVGPKV